jgi:hypothetical protein
MNATKTYGRKLSTRIAVFGALLAAVILSGCASTGHQDAGTLALDLSMPAPGKSKVVFIRPKSDVNALHFGVHDGERLIGRSSASTYFVYECDAGHHVFSSSFGNVGILNAELLPDRIYYVKVMGVLQSWGPAWVKMTALYPGGNGIDWAQMPNVLAELRKSIVSNDQVEHDRTGIEGYRERMKKYQSSAESINPEYGQIAPLALR